MIHIRKRNDGRSFLQISVKPQYFLFILLLVLLLVGLFQIPSLLQRVKKDWLPTKANVTLSPTPAPIDVATWQTYVDYVHHFSLKYPRELNVIPDIDYFAVTDKANPSLGIVTGRDDKYFQISVRVEPAKGESLDEYIKRLQFDKWRDGQAVAPYEIDGIHGYKITGIGMDSHTDLVLVKKDDDIYTIAHRRFYANISAGEEVYMKVLSTFTFLD